MKTSLRSTLTFTLALFLLPVSCNLRGNSPKLTKSLPKTPAASYKALKTTIDSRRTEFHENIFHEPIEKRIASARTYLLRTLVDDIFPHWYGTDWDFNGTTEVPGEGSIACGYFITTTLRDVGFNLNRYKIAQQASSVIVEVLCDPESIKTYTSIPKMEAYLQSRPDGLYIIGLDFHTGFILRENGKSYFIHSDYGYVGSVVKETLSVSKALRDSQVFVIGDLLSNASLIRKWINTDAIRLDR